LPICRLLEEISADIVALQEVTKHNLPELAARLGDLWWVALNGTAILSRLPLKPLHPSHVAGKGSRVLMGAGGGCVKPRSTTRHSIARVRVPTCHGCQDIDVVCVHLDHVSEKKRIAEMASLLRNWEAGAHFVLLGDFNALTVSDYSKTELRRISDVRKRSKWEPPVSDLSDALRGHGKNRSAPPAAQRLRGLSPRLIDTWEAAQYREGPIATSRYNTRIDYIFLSPELAGRVVVHGCECRCAIPHASDHNAVVATAHFRDDGDENSGVVHAYRRQ